MGGSVRVNVELNTADFKAGVDALKSKFPYALRRALKRAGTSGRAEMVKAIAADTGLPSRRIRDEIKINELGSSGIQLEIAGRRLPLIDFRARGPEPSRGRGQGVSYKLPGGRGRAEHAFIATMRSGHRGVFQRSPGARATKTAKGWSGLAIYQLHGPSLVRVFEKFLPLGAQRAMEALIANVKSEIKFALSRR